MRGRHNHGINRGECRRRGEGRIKQTRCKPHTVDQRFFREQLSWRHRLVCFLQIQA